MWTPKSFDEACRRAAGRRAYNARRQRARERRITQIIALQERGDFTGRSMAAYFGVHEATISRDLAFIEKVRREYRKTNWGAEMRPSSFRFIRGGGYETVFHIQHGVRLR
jgi:predicted DNA-binding transcriptional regulator YafY